MEKKLELNKEKRKELKEKIRISNKLLKNTQGEFQKNLLENIFKDTNDDNDDDIKLRLIILDSLYSTNLSKRYFPIQDLIKIIKEIKKDEVIKSPTKFFKNNIEFLMSNVGIHKNGSDAGHCFSLISKYLYFLTDYQFPIYDSLVYTELINQEFLKKQTKKPRKEYFETLEDLKKELSLENYDKLDLYFWICGKIRKNNFSLILNKKDYMRLLDKSKIKKLPTKNKEEKEKISKEIDSKISNVIKKGTIDEVSFKLIEKLAENL